MTTAEAKPAFAHPTEAQFARVLDFYRMRWEYEPRTFDLEWDEDGNVTTAFTPDFYLPDEDLYIELTTLRPKLATFKNRKLRLMQDRYPEISIKLFKRRDVRKLLIKYGLDEHAGPIMDTEAQE